MNIDRCIVNGEYEVQLLRSDSQGAYYDGAVMLTQASFAIEVNGRVEGIAGLRFGIPLQNGNEQVSSNVSASASEVAIFKGVGTQFSDLLRKSTPAVKSGSESNRIRLEVRGAELQYFLNDQPMGTVTDPMLGRRPLSVFLGAWDNVPVKEGDNARVFFDDIRIYVLP